MKNPSVNSIVERLFEKFGDDPLISEAADSLIGWSSANAKLKTRALIAESSLSRIKAETIEAAALVIMGAPDWHTRTSLANLVRSLGSTGGAEKTAESGNPAPTRERD